MFNKNAYVYITQKATFSAAHRLHSPELSDEENKKVYGKCNNKNGHGHNYLLKVTLKWLPDPVTGMVINFTDLIKIINDTIIKPMDHFYLNKDVEIFKEVIPTAENMAIVFWNLLKDKLPEDSLYEICLHETEKNICFYRG